MPIKVAVALFILFSAGWTGFSFIELLGSTLGDCFDNERCRGIKEFAPGLVLWRWLAIQLAAVIVLMMVRKR